MNYEWHTRINFVLLSGCAGLLIRAGNYLEYEVALFWLLGMFHTIFMSPDIDHKKSKPTRHMGIIGRVTSSVFTHRGILHNPYFWTVIYFGLFIYTQERFAYEAWWFCGGLLAIYIHIALDFISTKIKRIKTKLRKAFHV